MRKQEADFVAKKNCYFYNIDMICEKYWYWLIYVYVYWIYYFWQYMLYLLDYGLFSFHSLMIKKNPSHFISQLILKYISFKEF